MERKESGRCVYRLTDYPEINPEMAKPLLLMRGENGPFISGARPRFCKVHGAPSPAGGGRCADVVECALSAKEFFMPRDIAEKSNSPSSWATASGPVPHVSLRGVLSCGKPDPEDAVPCGKGRFGEALRYLRARNPVPRRDRAVCPHFCQAKCNRDRLEGCVNTAGAGTRRLRSRPPGHRTFHPRAGNGQACRRGGAVPPG